MRQHLPELLEQAGLGVAKLLRLGVAKLLQGFHGGNTEENAEIRASVLAVRHEQEDGLNA